MTINDNHPNFFKFIRNEHKTLLFLQNNTFVGSKLNSLYVSAKKAIALFPKLEDKYLKNFSFLFDCDLEISIENRIRKLIIECQVTPNFDLVNYVVSICDKCDGDYSIMRKFHFDYAPLSINDREKKPIYHMQYGGKASPALINLNVNLDSIFPFLSTPRLFHYPVNLAILLDMIFTEFKSEPTEMLIKDDRWKKLIKENEDELLVPYIKNIGRFVTSGNHKNDYLIRDFYYGKAYEK